ncbi:ABC transporter permease [Mediterraneibacter sp. ICN-202921]|uniref:ABC transporter permease n=1 Tax=Mediterraneibacter sp. ICN-202921 TaxID=3134657 RepID=UPI0030BD78C1
MRRLNRKKNIGFCLGIVLLLCWTAAALFVPVFSSYTYTDIDANIQNQGSSILHLFGTDKFGRDIFVRVWYAARISLLVGAAGAFINGSLGILYGSISGYIGGKVDFILMRIADIIASVPSLLYVILLTLVMGAGAESIIAGICVAGWIDVARIVRGEILREKDREYIQAAKMEGIPAFRILSVHLLPNVAGPILVSLTFLVPQAVFTEAFLSFLGVGIAPPAASLGVMIQEAKSQLRLYPYQMVYPILILCILILAFHLIGRGMETVYREKTGR